MVDIHSHKVINMLRRALWFLQSVWSLTFSLSLKAALWRQQPNHICRRGENQILCWHVSDCSCCLWSPSGTCHCSHGSLFSLWSLWSHPQVHRMKNGLSNPGLHFHLFSEYPHTGEDCFLQHRALCQSAVARTRAGLPLQGQWPDVVFLRRHDACSGTSGTVNRSSTWLP